MAPRYGDTLPSQRFGATIGETPGLGKPLGIWPAEFQKYDLASWIGKVSSERTKALKIVQRFHEQEVQLAKTAGRRAERPRC